MSSIPLENFVPTGLYNHSVNNKVSVFLVVTQLENYQNIDSDVAIVACFLVKFTDTIKYVLSELRGFLRFFWDSVI